MKTILIGSVAAVGLLASTAMAEPLKLGDAQLTSVTAGFLDGSNLAIVNVFNANFGNQFGGDRGHGGGYDGGDNGNGDIEAPTVVPVVTGVPNGGGGDAGDYFGSVHIDLSQWLQQGPPRP